VPRFMIFRRPGLCRQEPHQEPPVMRPPSILCRALAAFVCAAAGALVWAAAAMAQPAPRPPGSDKPEMMENCPGLVAGRPRPILAAFKTALAGDQARIT
jgi:hypothetical protein